jgi:hypothetical protein
MGVYSLPRPLRVKDDYRNLTSVCKKIREEFWSKCYPKTRLMSPMEQLQRLGPVSIEHAHGGNIVCISIGISANNATLERTWDILTLLSARARYRQVAWKFYYPRQFCHCDDRRVRSFTCYTGTSPIVLSRILKALTKQPPRCLLGDITSGLFKEISLHRLAHRSIHHDRRLCDYGWRFAIRKQESRLNEREKTIFWRTAISVLDLSFLMSTGGATKRTFAQRRLGSM